MMTEKKIPKWKLEEVNELEKLLKENKGFIIASVESFPADKLHDIRRRLRGRALLKVTKNSLMDIALEEAGIKNEEIRKYLTGPNVIIFTSENPFLLDLELSKNKLRKFAVGGENADEDVILPAGDTGIAAGPMLSVFGKLKIQTKVQDGKIHIAKDTVIAKKGEKIPQEITPILQKLGIQPVYIQLKIKGAYYEDIVINGENLHLNIDDYRMNVISAHLFGKQLAVEISYPAPEVLDEIILIDVRRAISLASELGYVTPETVRPILVNSAVRAMVLASSISNKVDLGIELAKPQEKKEEKKEEQEKKPEEEKKGPSEEEIAGGLASLFG
ncbi:50S ribosomal protein L10 [Sulfolobales archaeon HS-7]|nr:50S ribosomal protein L10 [Sulfolobales archaeon HS-7]